MHCHALMHCNMYCIYKLHFPYSEAVSPWSLKLWPLLLSRCQMQNSASSPNQRQRVPLQVLSTKPGLLVKWHLLLAAFTAVFGRICTPALILCLGRDLTALALSGSKYVHPAQLSPPPPSPGLLAAQVIFSSFLLLSTLTYT
jgi:hypothetical protein